MNLKFWTWGDQSKDVNEYFKDARTLGQTVEVKEPKKKDISEPVYAFIKCFQANPKRFRLTSDVSNRRASLRTQKLNFTDTLSHETWRVYSYPLHYECKPYVIMDVDWMTEDEEKLITSTLAHYFNERHMRKEKILQARAKRKLDNERKRLMNIYT